MALSAERIKGVLWVSHQDEQTANAFSVDEARDLEEILLRHKDIEGLIWMSGHPRIFCSGGNLQFYKAQSDQKVNLMANRKIKKVFNSLSKSSFPTVCILNGDCFGGGVELVSSFDHVIALPHIFMGFWQRKQALTFGWGGGLRLRRRLHRGQLSALSLSSRNISAYEALSFGLVDEICSKTLATKKAQKWLENQSLLPKEPVESIKTWSHSTEAASFEKLWLSKYKG